MTRELRAEYARWEVREEYFGKWEEGQIICHTYSIDNAVTVVKAFLKANAGRPFRYKILKVAEDYKEAYDMLETWEMNEVTGELEEGSYGKYLDWVYTEDKNDTETKTLD